MIDRTHLRNFLNSHGFEAQANDQASLVFAERLIEVLGTITKEMADAGDTAASDAMDSDYDSRSETSHDYLRSDGPALIYKAMWSARFRGE